MSERRKKNRIACRDRSSERLIEIETAHVEIETAHEEEERLRAEARQKQGMIKNKMKVAYQPGKRVLNETTFTKAPRKLTMQIKQNEASGEIERKQRSFNLSRMLRMRRWHWMCHR